MKILQANIMLIPNIIYYTEANSQRNNV